MADDEAQAFCYSFALERLVAVMGELSKASDIATATAIIGDAARALTGADGASFVLQDGQQCYYADERDIAPLWQGKRLPLTACIGGWVMRHAKPAVIEDITTDPRVPAEAYRPACVKSLAMLPIRRDAPLGAIGIYWSSNYRPDAQELAILQALADATCVTLANLELQARQEDQLRILERQQARIRSQHATLDVFTRALAHDLKEPVRTLLSYSGLLLEEAQDQENHPIYLSYIHHAASRMEMLMDAVSRYTRLDDCAQAARSLCNLNETASQVRRNLAGLLAERGTTLQIETLPQLHADPAHLTQLLQNLIGNAVLHNSHPVTIEVRHSISAGHSSFAVADDGQGLNASQTELIFEPFRRLTHLAGCAGLGLAVCQRIVALYGGEIRCDSAPGRGAVFTFTLPATEKAECDYAPNR